MSRGRSRGATSAFVATAAREVNLAVTREGERAVSGSMPPTIRPTAPSSSGGRAPATSPSRSRPAGPAPPSPGASARSSRLLHRGVTRRSPRSRPRPARAARGRRRDARRGGARSARRCAGSSRSADATRPSFGCSSFWGSRRAPGREGPAARRGGPVSQRERGRSRWSAPGRAIPGSFTVRGRALRRAPRRRLRPARASAPPRRGAARAAASRRQGLRPPHPPQERINAAPDHARQARAPGRASQGRRSVRLRTGREEADALARAGISVPGRFPASARPSRSRPTRDPAHASRRRLVVRGGDRPRGGGQARVQLDWARLARSVDTLVILMGLKSLPRLARELIAHGRPAATPARVVRWGTTEIQETVVGTLADIAGPGGRRRGSSRPSWSSSATSSRCATGSSG